jgi:hypothetical protein
MTHKTPRECPYCHQTGTLKGYFCTFCNTHLDLGDKPIRRFRHPFALKPKQTTDTTDTIATETTFIDSKTSINVQDDPDQFEDVISFMLNDGGC